jgi:hypothetical protein
MARVYHVLSLVLFAAAVAVEVILSRPLVYAIQKAVLRYVCSILLLAS